VRTVEGSFICNIVHKKNAHCSTVVRSRYSSKSLLTSSVPLYDTDQACEAYNSWLYRENNTHDLELNALSVQFDGTNLEVNADCGNERGRPRIVAEAKQKTRLPNTYQATTQDSNMLESRNKHT